MSVGKTSTVLVTMYVCAAAHEVQQDTIEQFKLCRTFNLTFVRDGAYALPTVDMPHVYIVVV
jgi:hypothetical protein